MKLKNSVVFRLSVRFACILTSVVVLIIIAFFMFLRHLSVKQEERALERTVHQISRSVSANNPRILEKKLSELPFFISYIIYDTDTKEFLFKKNDKMGIMPLSEEKPKHFPQKFTDNTGTVRELNIVYMTKSTETPSGRKITVQIASNTDNKSSQKYIREMLLLIASAAVPILALSFLISTYITKKTMSPVVQMTKTAKRLSSTNLDELLPESGSGDELDILAQTFNSLFRTLKTDFDRERDFTGNVSHELKTPVAVILGQANLLRRWGKNEPEQLEKSLGIIISEAHSMEEMITNLLQLSKLDAKNFNVEKTEFSLEDFFERIRDEFSSISPQTEIQFRQEEKTVIKSNFELLHQLMTIVISNSIKFSNKEKPAVTISCKKGVREKTKDAKSVKTVEFSIEDNGPGFDEEILPHIFERFFRGDKAHERKAGGCGIGLSVAKGICEFLGGTITAENTENHNARIRLSFKQ